MEEKCKKGNTNVKLVLFLGSLLIISLDFPSYFKIGSVFTYLACYCSAGRFQFDPFMNLLCSHLFAPKVNYRKVFGVFFSFSKSEFSKSVKQAYPKLLHHLSFRELVTYLLSLYYFTQF